MAKLRFNWKGPMVTKKAVEKQAGAQVPIPGIMARLAAERDNLKQRLTELTVEINAVEEAIELLHYNPGFEKTASIIARFQF